MSVAKADATAGPATGSRNGIAGTVAWSERLARFREVLSQIPRNATANADQDARIKRLEAELAKLRKGGP
jgi:hypothetical protein